MIHLRSVSTLTSISAATILMACQVEVCSGRILATRATARARKGGG
ncbi:hypothetical protein [Parafrankia elaeagni]|nr:hypothetical protein [Parafrankia elaeagni]